MSVQKMAQPRATQIWLMVTVQDADWIASLAAELEAVLSLLAHEHLLRVDEDLDAARVQPALHAAPLKGKAVDDCVKWSWQLRTFFKKKSELYSVFESFEDKAAWE